MTQDPKAKLVMLGMDAMRIALGLPTRNFETAEVVRILRRLEQQQREPQ